MQIELFKPSSVLKKMIALIIFLLLSSNANYQIFGIDGRGYFATILAVCFLLFNSQKLNIKVFLALVPIKTWIFLTMYYVVNIFYMGENTFLTENTIVLQFVKSSLLIIYVTYLYLQDRDVLYKLLIITLNYILVVAYLYNEMTDSGRLSGFIYTTQLGQLCGVTTMVTSFYLYYKKRFAYSFFYILPVFVMFLAGSRNGFLFVILSFICLAVPYFFREKKLVAYSVVLISFVYYFAKDSTVLFRIEDQRELPLETGTIWDVILGDRIYYYVIGFQNFLDNPINGIGLLNFMDYNHYIYPIHSEPMTHLAEGGIIGFIIYLCFIGYYVKNFYRYCNTNTPILNQCLISFVSVFWIGLTARIYQYPFFFVLYGIFLAEILRTSQIISPNEKSIMCTSK